MTERARNRLVLCWMQDLDETGASQSRNRRAVGELIDNNGVISFRYLVEEASFKKAREEGFVEFPAFSLTELNAPYLNCMKIFSRRLVLRSRADFSNYLQSYAIDPSREYSDFDLLALTGGRNSTDTFEFIDPLNELALGSTTLIEVAGIRHYDVDFSKLSDGDIIMLIPEPENEKDRYALKVTTADNTQIGWVNSLQNRGLLTALGNSVCAKIFRLNGRVGYRRIFVLIDVDSTNRRSVAA